MYDGGIVGYNLGGRVQALIDEYRKKTYGVRNLSDEEILARIEKERPTEIAEYREQVYGTKDKSDAEIQKDIDASYSGRLKKDRTADLSDRGRAPDPMADMGLGMSGGSPTLEPLATERMEYTGEVDPQKAGLPAIASGLKKPDPARDLANAGDPTKVDDADDGSKKPAPARTGIAAVADPTGTDEMGKALREKIAALGEEGKEGAFQTGLTRAKTVMQDDDIRSEKDQARMDELYRKQEELEKKYTKSDAQTSLDRFIAGAAGMSGRGYTTAKGGAEALAEFEAAELKRDRDFLNDYKAIAEGDLQARDNIRDRLLASADKSESEQRADIRSAISAGASVYGTMSREDQEAANRENDIRIAEYNTKVQADVEKERNRIRQEGNDQNFKFQMAQLDRLSANDRRDAILERRMFIDNAMLDARSSVEEFLADDMNADIIEEDMERLGIESIEDYRARLMEMRITRLSSYDEIVAANKAIKELEDAPDEDFSGFSKKKSI
jgi:hypothetical protein